MEGCVNNAFDKEIQEDEGQVETGFIEWRLFGGCVLSV